MPHMRDIVNIGQVWQRKGRRKNPERVLIRQVHRADRAVEAYYGDLTGTAPWPEDGKAVHLIGFADLRRRYRLVV